MSPIQCSRTLWTSFTPAASPAPVSGGWAGLGWARLGCGLEPACSIRCDSIIVVAAAASRKRIVVRFSEYVQSVVRGCVQAAGVSV